MSNADLSGKIPNNVHLKDDKKLLRALESWQPKFMMKPTPSRPARWPTAWGISPAPATPPLRY